MAQADEEVSEKSKTSSSAATAKKPKKKKGKEKDEAALEKEWERMENEMEAAGKMPLPGFEPRDDAKEKLK